MENQILGILQQIAKDVQGLKDDMNDMKQDMQGMKQEINDLKQDMQGMKQEINDLKQDMQDMKQEINDLKQDMQGVKEEISVLKQDMHGVKYEIQGIKQDIQGMQQEIQDIKQEMQGMKQDIAKNAALIEENNRKLQLLAEIQQAHREQTDRQFVELKAEMNNRMDIIEAVVRSISKDVQQNKKSISALAGITGNHEMEIRVIKRELALME
ncbi:coiled-coil domain-containing protein [Carboxydothermus ferrireducens]|uniref:Chromosome segregation ATPase n=1 Tax=Carboxydothermus ferrireducens DSM 11255 TaxID=1119529 RepID=A0ABX2RBL6_9THEO|nr:hypothetical protein [Carboxydothermus ferrireducens]NYE58410.1 chromosome segregation ATPase [Carboxydothermus ferrireducens DSM 11255]